MTKEVNLVVIKAAKKNEFQKNLGQYLNSQFVN